MAPYSYKENTAMKNEIVKGSVAGVTKWPQYTFAAWLVHSGDEVADHTRVLWHVILLS